MPLSHSELPNLVYIGDVPVEESFAGSAFFYRLLSSYPPERLLILESNLQSPAGGRRLDGVRYGQFTTGWPRLLRTRLSAAYGAYLSETAPARLRRIAKLLKSFRPEAVLTVGHGVSWRIADALARTRHVPLHLVIHDDWRVALLGTGFARNRIRRQYENVYARAAGCYCISPYMQQAYAQEFGREGSVLMPLRRDGLVYERPKTPRSNGLTFAYAGSLHNSGYRDQIIRLARLLPEAARFLLFTPGGASLIPDSLGDRITLREPLPADRLIETLREEADVLFCPSSFLADERVAMSINLPSKLAEYTATGLPIFVWGPEDSSAVKWTRDNPGAALVATDNSDVAARSVVEQFRDGDLRERHAGIAMEVGASQFSGANVRQIFYQGLSGRHGKIEAGALCAAARPESAQATAVSR